MIYAWDFRSILELLNSIWTCIRPKSRLYLKNFLTTLCVKFNMKVQLSTCVQVCVRVYNRVPKFLIVLKMCGCATIL